MNATSSEVNTILLDSKNTGSFRGPLACPYSYKPELRQRLTELWEVAMLSSNRFFVLEGTTCRAAQSTMKGALEYMGEGCVLVEVEAIPHDCVEHPNLPCPACNRAEGKAR